MTVTLAVEICVTVSKMTTAQCCGNNISIRFTTCASFSFRCRIPQLPRWRRTRPGYSRASIPLVCVSNSQGDILVIATTYHRRRTLTIIQASQVKSRLQQPSIPPSKTLQKQTRISYLHQQIFVCIVTPLSWKKRGTHWTNKSSPQDSQRPI